MGWETCLDVRVIRPADAAGNHAQPRLARAAQPEVLRRRLVRPLLPHNLQSVAQTTEGIALERAT